MHFYFNTTEQPIAKRWETNEPAMTSPPSGASRRLPYAGSNRERTFGL